MKNNFVLPIHLRPDFFDRRVNALYLTLWLLFNLFCVAVVITCFPHTWPNYLVALVFILAVDVLFFFLGRKMYRNKDFYVMKYGFSPDSVYNQGGAIYREIHRGDTFYITKATLIQGGGYCGKTVIRYILLWKENEHPLNPELGIMINLISHDILFFHDKQAVQDALAESLGITEIPDYPQMKRYSMQDQLESLFRRENRELWESE